MKRSLPKLVKPITEFGHPGKAVSILAPQASFESTQLRFQSILVWYQPFSWALRRRLRLEPWRFDLLLWQGTMLPRQDTRWRSLTTPKLVSTGLVTAMRDAVAQTSCCGCRKSSDQTSSMRRWRGSRGGRSSRRKVGWESMWGKRTIRRIWLLVSRGSFLAAQFSHTMARHL